MVNAAMPALLLIPPLHLDAVNAVVVDPSEQVLELLTRRPTAVVSTIAAIVAHHDVRTVAFLEPVAGLADGGYARQCVRLLETDLAARGVRTVGLEGGPSLNGQFLEAGVVDEVNLSLAPLVVAGSSARMAHSAGEVARHLHLAHVWEQDDLLLCRYLRP